jgi:hypothetical protein
VRSSIVKLDLLYEIDVPKPGGKPHPSGQRAAEPRADAAAHEQSGIDVDAQVSAS